MRNFASTLVKFSKLSHIQTTIWRPPKMAPPPHCGVSGALCYATVTCPLQFSGWITCTPPVPRLNHVLPSSSQTASRALLQFPGCITCSPPVPRLYHVLPSSSQNVSCPRNDHQIHEFIDTYFLICINYLITI